MARAGGLDVGANHVRRGEAGGGGRGRKVIRLGEREVQVPEGGSREDAVREAVDALFRDTRASRDEVCMTWPAESCVLREVHVPFREPDQIRKVFRFEFESHLHGRDIDDYVVDFVPTGDTREGGARLFCAGAEKAPLRERLHSLQKIKVDPVAVDLDATCLLALLAATGTLAENPTLIAVDAGARSTRILLVVDGKLRSARAFRAGVDTVALGVEEDLGGAPGTGTARVLEGPRPDDLMAFPGAGGAGVPAPDLPAAETSAATLEVAVVEGRRGDYLERLSRELTRTLAQASSGAGFPLLLLTGRGARIPGVREDLGSRLGVEVRTLDLFSRVPSPVPPEMVEEADACYAAALGAAARALGASPSPLDLRREDLSYARRFDQIKGGLAAILGMLLLGVGFLLWRAKTEKEIAAQEFGAMTARLKETADQVEAAFKRDLKLSDEDFEKKYRGSGDPLKVVPDYGKRVGQMHNLLRNEMGLSTEVPPIASSLEAFRKVHAALTTVREQLAYCMMNTETYTQRGLDFTLVLSAPEHVDIVRNTLLEIKDGDVPLFAEVVPGTVSQDRTGKYPVPFNCVFKKGGAE